MSDAPRGYIAIEHTVWCGGCNNWERVSESTIKGTKKAIIKLGWKYRSWCGWLCPHCLKQGSGVTMEMRFPVLWQGPCKLLEELRVLGCPRDVPWDLVAPHEPQALRNHDQTLKRLAERGGLSPAELLAVLEDRTWRLRSASTDAEAVLPLLQLIGKAGYPQ